MYLNYLPLRFTSDVFRGGILPFEGGRKELTIRESDLFQKLRELRKKHESTHIFLPHGRCHSLHRDNARRAIDRAGKAVRHFE